MPDFILLTGDKAMFNPAFGPATAMVMPGTLVGTGRKSIGGKPVCVAGDEAGVVVPGVAYMTPSHSVPGVGILSIAALGADQKARTTSSGGKPVLLKGSTFQAKLQVVVPAMTPTPVPVPDPTPQYAGTGSFVTTNLRVRGA